jgi:hypothetical protein
MREEKKEPPPEDEDEDDAFELAPLEEAEPESPSVADFLELVPEAPSPAPPPEFYRSAKPEREEERDGADRDPEEDEEESVPPRLAPFEPVRFLAWPLRGGNADELVVSLFLLAIVLMGAWVVGQIPVVGWALRVLVLLGAGFYYFTFPVKVARCAAEGQPAPSILLSPGLGDEGYGFGIRLGIVLVLYALPAGLLGRALVTPEWPEAFWFTLPVALLTWTVIPAAILNLAATGGIFAANPVDAFRLARAGKTLYLKILVPGAIFILTRYIVADSFNAVWVGVLGWIVLVYTAEAVGLLANEHEEFGARLLEITGLPRSASEDEPEAPPPPGTQEDPGSSGESS